MTIPTADQCSWTSQDDIAALATEVVKHFGVLDVTVLVVIDGRFVASAVAGAFRKGRKGAIVVNRRHWRFLPPDIRWRVIVHEACHLVDMWRRGQRRRVPESELHGPKWVALMEEAGADPMVINNEPHLWTVERVRAVFPRRKWVLHCSSCTFAWGLTDMFVRSLMPELETAQRCDVCAAPLLISPLPAL